MKVLNRLVGCGASLAAIVTAAPFLVGGANAAVVISSGATQNVNCSGGVCAPTATDAVLNAGDLETLLASGNVTVTTNGSGVQAKDIRVAAAVSWSTGSALTLDAWQSLTINRPVSVQGLAGLKLTTNDGGKNGMLSFGQHGNVTFANLSSSLTINSMAYMLDNSIKSLAAAIAANPSGAFALANSYDASQDGIYPAAPVSTTFTGSFEGLGNTISKLSVDDPTQDDDVGLFAQLGSGGALDYVRLRSIDIRGPSQPNIDAFEGTGGLVGLSEGSLTGDSVTGRVSIDKSQTQQGVGALGGLVGYMDGGSIVSSGAGVKVIGRGVADECGGLAGFIASGSVALSHASGGVKGRNTLGGLTGVLGGLGQTTISQSFATGAVTGAFGNAAAGGLVGVLIGGNGLAKIVDSYATGNVSHLGELAAVGGLVGAADSSDIGSSYSTGAPSGKRNAYVGGFLGENEDDSNTMTNANWDTTTSGTDVGVGEGDDAGVTGLTTEQLQSGLPKGFSRKVWGEDPAINGGLPYLLANQPGKRWVK
jgi:hypothetical protein